jgi:hypothetical protein
VCVCHTYILFIFSFETKWHAQWDLILLPSLLRSDRRPIFSAWAKILPTKVYTRVCNFACTQVPSDGSARSALKKKVVHVVHARILWCGMHLLKIMHLHVTYLPYFSTSLSQVRNTLPSKENFIWKQVSSDELKLEICDVSFTWHIPSMDLCWEIPGGRAAS